MLHPTRPEPHEDLVTTTRARRMAPEERREQLLDSAVAYIMERGLSDFSLEKIAQRAGVSTPLIYKYFPKREDILRAVLEREYRYLGAHKLSALPQDAPLELPVAEGRVYPRVRLFEAWFNFGMDKKKKIYDQDLIALARRSPVAIAA